MKSLVQIAGIGNMQEAELLMECGVDRLGFPLRLDYHKPDLDEAEAVRIIEKIKKPHEAVIITYLNEAAELATFCRRLKTTIVQLHGDVSLTEIRRIRNSVPQLKIIKSLIVQRDNLDRLREVILSFAAQVDAFITDTYDPSTGASGATGKTHDWTISRELVRLSSKPVILAGGLNPENVGAAIRKVRPSGVDAHTGVEDASGRKDRDKVSAFVREAKKAFREMEAEYV